MYFSDSTVDDLLRRVLQKLLLTKNRPKPSRGNTAELGGVLVRLKKPRARLSRTQKKGTIFSCLGELLWYLARSDAVEFISYYIPRYADEAEHGKILGAYGPRLFTMRGLNQIDHVIRLLRSRPNSRRAVIQLFNAEDLAEPEKPKTEIPCTCTLQFLLRRERLSLFTSMRSNDAFVGLPHDLFTFTMLQEIVARSLGKDIGEYRHFVGSMHLYDADRGKAEKYLEEGWQPTQDVAMPAMPWGDPWKSIGLIVKAEAAIRGGKAVNAQSYDVEPYWKDLIRLLQIYNYTRPENRRKDDRRISQLKRAMTTPLFDTYISRRAKVPAPSIRPSQQILPFAESED
jgi:thymidylate synthase